MLRALVRNYLSAAYTVGDGAEDRYSRALEDLRKEPEAAAAEIARALGEADAHDFPSRSALIYAARELGHRSTLPLLIGIVDTPIPPELEPPKHGLGIAAEEIILRTSAVDGISRLAGDGDETAQAALIRYAGHHAFSIRRASVQGALRARPNDHTVRETLLAVLPGDQHFLLDLNAAVVEAVEQPKPERHLRPDRSASGAPPDPSQPKPRSSRDEPRPRGKTERPKL